MRDRLDLHLGVADASRDRGAAERREPRLENEGAGREVIGEGIVHDIARPEAGGEERARHAVDVPVMALRLEDRPGRHQQAFHLAGRRDVEAAERRPLLLQRHEIGLAQERELRERGARGDGFRIDAGKLLRPSGRGERAGDRLRESGELLPRARLRIARLQLIVEIRHGSDRYAVWRRTSRRATACAVCSACPRGTTCACLPRCRDRIPSRPRSRQAPWPRRPSPRGRSRECSRSSNI